MGIKSVIKDINKQTVLKNHSSHSSRVDFIRAFVDYVHTNVYFSASIKERRAIFYDIRTSKAIKTVTGLPDGIIDIQNNEIGKSTSPFI